jgi:spermidine synthase
MNPFELIDQATVPTQAGGKIALYRRGDEYSIRVANCELMSSRMHGSEDVLAELACQALHRPKCKVLIGGLGMGFTLAKTLQLLGAQAEVMIAELIPAVIQWNQSHLAALAGEPLQDKRVRLHQGDVAALIRAQSAVFDAIMLDVDNGPDGLTCKENEQIYGASGLKAAHQALKRGGVLAVWSVAPDATFTARFKRAGFHVEVVQTPARGKGKRGTKHTIWVGKKR